eukprot:TRINITY_DN9558_c0_g1_i8.p1 TRINITY_DN9558_c0_g1~~TRINITY_DN9558_c0_g1_i8.p1  ORF type:complete len:116 (-),score=6.27 TRINITY_DN9558_c0_g1_i8:68-415(-)
MRSGWSAQKLAKRSHLGSVSKHAVENTRPPSSRHCFTTTPSSTSRSAAPTRRSAQQSARLNTLISDTASADPTFRCAFQNSSAPVPSVCVHEFSPKFPLPRTTRGTAQARVPPYR